MKQDSTDIIKIIEGLRETAIREAPGFQPWDNYYRLRAKEMEILLSSYNIKSNCRILEIGCGNGFVSAILSRFAGEVVATDLSKPDLRTHSVGIVKAKELFNRLGVKNCSVISSSGEKLPFKDRTFDVVFSAHTLEHIPDRLTALGEVKRILKDGGDAVFILPGIAYRLFHPIYYYWDLGKKGIWMLFNRNKKAGPHSEDDKKASAKYSQWEKFRKSYPHFPFPEPHGEYNNFFEELMNYRIKKWRSLFKANGLKIVKVFSTILIPRDILGICADPLKFYENNSWIEKRLGTKKFFRNIGQDICIVARGERDD